MVVLMRPNFLLDGLRFILSISLALPFYFAPRELNSPSQFCALNFIITILFGLVFYSIYNKRSVKCVVKHEFGTIQYERGGLLGTALLSKSLNFNVSDIVGFEMRHGSRGRWHRFQILGTLKSGKQLDLAGKDLSYTEAQTAIEKIRRFINPHLPIKVIY
jgi:hypothetical protein